jgi:hypothetical protein
MLRLRTLKIIAITLIIIFAAGAALGMDIISAGSITDCLKVGPAYYDLLDSIPTKE